MNRSLSVVLKPAVMLDLQNLKTSGNKQAYDDLIAVVVFHKESLSRFIPPVEYTFKSLL